MKKRKAKLIEIFNDPSEKYATSLMDKKSLKAAEVSICRDLTEKNQDGNKMKFDLKIARKESGELKFLAIRKHKSFSRYPQILPRRLYKLQIQQTHGTHHLELTSERPYKNKMKESWMKL